VVEVESLPISRALRAATDPEQSRSWALGAGDDYELLIAVAPERFGELAARADQLNLRLTPIGELCRGNAVRWTSRGAEFEPSVGGFDHFRRASTQITV
jgi:thiamine-monophosphate kinase